MFNFRYSPASTVEALKNTLEALLEKHHLNYTILWQHTSKCFMSSLGTLHNALQKSIETVTTSRAKTSTTGGTSDGRFIAPYGIETIECGFPNGTIHQVNEHIEVEDIEKLAQIYYQTLCELQCH